METYSIGKFTFDSKEKYEQALKEFQLIKKIKEQYDLEDSAIQKKILLIVKSGKWKFDSTIGIAFVDLIKRKYMESTVTKASQKVLEEKTQESIPVSTEERKEPKQRQMTVSTDVAIRQQSKPQAAAKAKKKVKEDRVEIPIVKKASLLRNLISIMLFLASYVVCVEAFIRYGESGLAIAGLVIFIYYVVIGIKSISRQEKNEAKARQYVYDHMTPEEKEEFDKVANGDQEDISGWGILITIAFVALCIIVPPIGIIALIVLAFIRTKDYFVWLLKNLKAGLGAFIIFLSYVMVFAATTETMRQASLNGTNAFATPADHIRWCTIIVLMSLIPVFLLRLILGRQFYLGIRYAVTFLLTFTMAVLPFLLIAFIVYQRNNSNGGNGGNGGGVGGTGPSFIYDGQPPIYTVNGYSYVNSHGTRVVVNPYPRSMPDASVWNNLRPPR